MLDPKKIEEITGALPSMPQVIVKVLKLLDNDRTPNLLLADAIAHDPFISARVLALANSPVYGRTKVAKLDQAISIIGRSAIKTAALERTLKAVNALKGGLGQMLWENSIGCAVGARMIALKTSLADQEEAFVAGMFCSLGKVVLAMRAADGYLKLLETSAKKKVAIEVLEMEHFGVTHEVVSAAVLEKWNLGPSLVQAVLHYKDLKNTDQTSSGAMLSKVVNIAATFSEKSGIGQICPNETLDVTKILGAYLLHLQPAQMQQFYDSFIESFQEDREYYLS